MQTDYLRHRVAQIEYLQYGLRDTGVTVSTPTGGSAVVIDVMSLYPHLRPEDHPGIAFTSDIYLRGGVRAAAIPFELTTIDPGNGDLIKRPFTMARLALPRRVYGQGHLDHVIATMQTVREVAHEAPAYRCVSAPRVLAHFFARFEPIRSRSDAATSLDST